MAHQCIDLNGDYRFSITDYSLAESVVLPADGPTYVWQWYPTINVTSKSPVENPTFVYGASQSCPTGYQWVTDPSTTPSTTACANAGGSIFVTDGWARESISGGITYQFVQDGVVKNKTIIKAVPATLTKVSGDGQTALTNTELDLPLVATVEDFKGLPVPEDSQFGPGDWNGGSAPHGAVNWGVTGITFNNGVLYGSAQVGNLAGAYTFIFNGGNQTTPSSVSWTVNAVDQLPPDDNPDHDQNNGNGTDSPDGDKPPENVSEPINITDGNNVHGEVDYVQTGLSPIEFKRTYNSFGSKSHLMNNYWTTTYDRFVIPPSGSTTYTRLRRPDGLTIHFTAAGNGTYTSDPFFHGTLAQNGTGWKYTDVNQTVENYDSTGKLTTITDLRGRIQTLTYASSGLLSKVSANTGESLTFQYNSFNQIKSVTDQANRVWQYTYDGHANLTQVTRPDQTTRNYYYTHSSNPYLLTRIVDAATDVGWEYDSSNRATANYFTIPSGSTTTQLARYDIGYNSDGTRSLMDGNKHVSSYGTAMVNGHGFVSSVAGPAFATAGDDLSRTFDSEMNVLSKTKLGHTTLFGNYDSKGQFGYKIMGSGTPSQIETDYVYASGLFNKPTQITEPSVVFGQSKVTSLTYDAYGNITQRTIAGYRPGIGSNPPVAISRTWDYVYNGPYHQLTQTTGPRTDVAQVTKLTYNAAGRLSSITDANNILVRNNITYTSTGNVLSEDRPNGLHLAYSYYAGSDLLHTLTETQGGKSIVTTWTYDGADRNVTSIAFSDGVNTDQVVNFQYNNASLLTEVTSDAGTIHYSFDDQGNRTNDSYRDSSGTEQRWIQRTFDAYNRLNKVIGANNTIEYNFNPDGTLGLTKDGQQQPAQRQYDGLLRLSKIIRPDTSQIGYAYDTGNNLNQTTDPNSATTTYVFDDFGNKVEQISPDTGTTFYRYDLAGNLTQMTDAKGQVTNYAYDAESRLLTVDRDGTDYDETYTYDNCTYGTKFLCSATTGAGQSIAYTYDGFGRIASYSTLGKTISYAFDARGGLTQVTYPSGRAVKYMFNGDGQIIQVTVTENGNVTTLANNVTHEPFGPVTGWAYGNSLAHTRQYDKQYWTRLITTPNVSTLSYLQYDLNGNLQTLAVDGTSDQFTYDVFDELKTGTGDFGARSYIYDPVGNRSTLTADAANTSYTYTPQSNRIAMQTGYNYTLDPNGNTTQKMATDGTGSGYGYSYSPHNRLIAVYDLLAPAAPKATYRYNAFGQRAAKIVNGVETRFIYGLDGKLLAETDVSGNVLQEYVYLDGAPLTLLSAPIPVPPSNYDVNEDTSATTGSWTAKSDSIAVGGTYSYLSLSKASTATATWNWNVPSAGRYDVYVWWIGSGEATTNYRINGTLVGVTSSAQVKGKWTKLGNFHFAAGANTTALNGADNAVSTKAYISADAARIVLTQADAPINPNYLYVHSDHLGAPRALTNENGTLVWKAFYDPFGQAYINDDVANTGKQTTLNLRFSGQYFDVESGMHQNGLRDYDPMLGRYLESDPIGLLSGPNSYVYGGENPLSRIDPTGDQWVEVLIKPMLFSDEPIVPRPILEPKVPNPAGAPVPELPPDFPSLPDDPSQPPGTGWQWRGKGPPGGDQGAWYNPEKDWSLHPDLDHPEPIGPHWDWVDENGKQWRVFPKLVVCPNMA